MTLANLLGVLTLVVGVPLLWLAWHRLRRFSGRYGNPVVRVQAIAVGAVLIHAIVFGLIFIQNDLVVPPIDLGTSKLITRGIELGVALVVALGVLLYFRRGESTP